MTARPKIIDMLRTDPDAAANRALAAGLACVEPDFQSELIDALLQRGHSDGLVALVENLHLLAEAPRRLIFASTSQLFSALRRTIKSSSLQCRLNSLELIRRCRNPRLAYLAAAAIHDGSGQVRAEAAQTLRELTLEHCARHEETAQVLRDIDDDEEPDLRHPAMRTLHLLREERQHLYSALQEALSHFESHHRLEVLEAAMSFADDLEPVLFPEDPVKRGKLSQAMIEVFSANPPARFAAFAYLALAQPELRRHVIRVISNLRDDDFFMAFIRARWLARDPRVRHWLSMIRSLAWMGEGGEAAFSLPPDVAGLAPSWIAMLGLPTDQKVQLINCFLILDNPRANLAAVWALVGIQSPDVAQALQGALDHDDPAVRRIAEHELKRRLAIEQKRKPATIRGRPPIWTKLLETADLTEDFEEFWLHFERIPRNLARLGAALAFQFVPGLQTQLQVKLASVANGDRQRALKMIGAMHLADKFTREIYQLANDADAEVRAGAMQCLGRIPGHTSRRILTRALGDMAPGVQAAAIESLHYLGVPDRVELFTPRLECDQAVVRAAAVQALLKMQQPQAAMTLIHMLQDLRDDHRCHALWIVEALRLHSIGPRIAAIAESDPNPRIARIARHIHRKLILGASAPERSVLPTSAGDEDPLHPTGVAV